MAPPGVVDGAVEAVETFAFGRLQKVLLIFPKDKIASGDSDEPEGSTRIPL